MWFSSSGACRRGCFEGAERRFRPVGTGGIVEIVIVNFSLDGMSEAEYEQLCTEVAPAFAVVPGLASKVWLADRAEGIFGGVYTFVSRESVDEFLASELFAGVGATPGLVNISVRRFGVLDSPTSVTRGLAPAAV